MRSYITLGEASNTKVLAHSHTTATTVVTCDHATATRIAAALSSTAVELDAAMYPLAVTHAASSNPGAPHQVKPIEARRRLLATFDARLRARRAGIADDLGKLPVYTGEIRGELAENPWGGIELLVSRVADAVTGAPDAVANAVRAEVAGHLDGLDGIQVPARVTSHGYKTATLDLSLTSGLNSMDDRWWTDQFTSSVLHTYQADRRYRFLEDHEGLQYLSFDSFPLVDVLWDREPALSSFHEASVQAINAEAGDSEVADILVREIDVRSWLAHHRPHLLEPYLSELGG